MLGSGLVCRTKAGRSGWRGLVVLLVVAFRLREAHLAWTRDESGNGCGLARRPWWHLCVEFSELERFA